MGAGGKKPSYQLTSRSNAPSPGRRSGAAQTNPHTVPHIANMARRSDIGDAALTQFPLVIPSPPSLPTGGQGSVPLRLAGPKPARGERERRAILTVAKSFCVMPLLCRPCWITLPTSSGTLSWCSSSVSRSSLAVFFVMKCCLFWPAAPAMQSGNRKKKTRTNKTRLRAGPESVQALFLSAQLPRIPRSFQACSAPAPALISGGSPDTLP